MKFSELSTDEQENLQAQIEKLKFEMHTRFLKLEAETVYSLHERVAATDIVRTLLQYCTVTVYPTRSVSLLQGHKQALLDAKDTKEVFIIISPFYSYYNYELIQMIVDVHGSERDKEKMRQYILEFSEYCRMVPCVEFYDNGCQTSRKQVNLKLKLDYDKELLTLTDIKNIQSNISKILNIRPCVLYFHSVDLEDGCTAVTFLFPDPCFHAVVKLLKEKTTILQREVKMMTIECDGKHINEVCTYSNNYVGAFCIPVAIIIA